MAERIRSSGAQFFVCFVEAVGAMSVTQRNVHFVMLFQKSWNKIVYLKRVLAVCKICKFVTLQRNINFQFLPSLTIVAQLSLCTISCVPQQVKRKFGA